MNVQQFLDQERGLRQQRDIGAFAAETERRARAASRVSHAFRMSEQLWRTNEQLGGFQKLTNDMTRFAMGSAFSQGGFHKLTDDLTRSAMGSAFSQSGFHKLTDNLTRSAIGDFISPTGNAISEMMRASGVFHRLMDPIPALRSVLGSFTAISPAFDSTQYVKPLAKLDHQMDFLRDHSFSRLAELRSTAFETMKSVSAIVGLVKPFAVNPLFQTDSVAGKYVDLAAVVHYADSHFAAAAATSEIADLLRAFIEKFECEMATSRADARGSSTLSLWVAILGLLVGIFALYQNQASKHNDAAPLPMLQPQASPSPATPHVTTPHPAPKGLLV